MRTTLTLDDALAQKLKEIAHQRKESFKDTVNRMLSRGLYAQELEERRTEPFRVQAFDSAFRPGADPTKLNHLSDELEVDHEVGVIQSMGRP